MRELTENELALVSGGGLKGDLVEDWGFGTAVGGTLGAVATGATRGVMIGGAIGGAVGLSWGVGWATGSWIYRRFVKPTITG
jgi:bacteriocin-like protein